MKKFLSLVLTIATLFTSCTDPYDDTDIRNDIEDLKGRVTVLEKLCKEMNSNILAMQTILNAVQNNDYITAINPITEDGIVIGYTINFTKSAPVTIYHGKDGKDGQNGSDGKDGQDGTDGKDGYTPVIGVKQDTDGIYYWTLDGEWLLDEDGNKIKAVGTDGKDGQNGTDGKDGQDGENGTDGKDGQDGTDGKDGQDGADGKDGADGITPQLKIENGYWYISYDNGKTWTMLDKATGENGTDGKDGQDGADGKDGADGDSFFQSVDTSNNEYIIFTLADGTEIKVPTWYAFEQLRTLCNQMNSNITALQTIVSALQNNDYVTSVAPIVENGKTIGYTINFSKSGPVTIYHGKDGQNGEDGKDGSNGMNGHTPVISVKQDADGIYYWTLDGEWLLDEDGNKIKAVGTDGKDGQNGTDGKDGQDGADGKDGENGTDGKDGQDGADGKDGADGITPQLKIENGYWYISYDNGTSWEQLGKATGEKGEQGDKGDKGDTGLIGDSMFNNIDYSNNEYVVFTLSNGATIQIPTWYAFEQLRTLCNQMNSNITALQTIVSALQNNDYVTSVAPIVENGKTIGYTINFSKSGPVTIYHGKDGQNGEDGKDGSNGLNGHTPVISVKQDTDGIYYWTLDGEWLLDEDGNKIKAVGTDGKDGQNGTDGKDGQDGENGTDGKDGQDGTDGKDGQDGADGKDGADGITPQLKIENGYWYISYDNGKTWTMLDKATGENGTDGKDGQDGADGKDGADGDSFFQSVDTSNSEYVIFTLADGTEIKVPTWYAFEQLRTLCNQMNSNITALQTIVSALQNNDYVTSVVPVVENGKTIGYTINFSKSGPVTIYHGKDGQNGEDGKDGSNGMNGHTPVISVKQDTDGIYYWTLDGEWLLDEDGNKIKAVGTDGKDGQNGNDGTNGEDGADGITPQLKIENGYWYISYDNGKTWTMLDKATGENGTDGKDGQDGADGKDGADGDSFFQSVTQDEEYVYFTLADGTVYTLPKEGELKISFNESDLLVMHANSTREISYMVKSSAKQVTVELTSSADIKAKVVTGSTDGKSGKIVINTGSSIDEYSKVIVFVSDGKKVIMKSLAFEQSGITISNGASHSIAATGGTLDIDFLTNMDCEVIIPSAAGEWLSIAPQTRAMTAHTATILVEPNHTLQSRFATIKITTTDGKLSSNIQITQKSFDEFTATTPQTGGWLANDAITIFAGNTMNRKFVYAGSTGAANGSFKSEAILTGTPLATTAHYAIYPFDSNAAITTTGAISTTFASEQKYIAGGMERKNNIMFAATNDVYDCNLNFQPLAAIICVKLWGTDQTIKSISITSNGGEALSGTATVKATPAGITSCTVNGASTIKLNGVNELKVGATQASATHFYFAVPPVALSQGYTVNVEGFYGGKQTINVGATSLTAGNTHTTTAQLTISNDGMGTGIGGWGDGGENGGTAD